MEGQFPGLPHPQGLYDPTLERDACGVGFVVNIDGSKSHKVSQWYLLYVNFLNKNLWFCCLSCLFNPWNQVFSEVRCPTMDSITLTIIHKLMILETVKIHKIIEKTTVSIQCVFEWIDTMHIVYRLLYICTDCYMLLFSNSVNSSTSTHYMDTVHWGDVVYVSLPVLDIPHYTIHITNWFMYMYPDSTHTSVDCTLCSTYRMHPYTHMYTTLESICYRHPRTPVHT